MKAVAHSFQTAESYSGYNGILRSQLLGTAKKGVRKEFAFEKPATAIEIVGFKYWFESTFNGLTPKNLKAETLYEKFMQMRDDARYQNALFKGEQVLRDEILHLEKQVESASDEPINLEKSRAVLAAIHANFAQAQAARREQIQAALEAKAQHRARVIQQRNEIIKKLEEEALIEQQQNEFFAKIEAGEIQ